MMKGQAFQKKISKPYLSVFIQSARTAKRLAAIQGLGLAFRRQITQAYGGSLTAENRKDADGKVLGARFIVKFRAL